MSHASKVYADFNNVDSSGRFRLNRRGTIKDLEKHHLELREGMKLVFTDDEEFEAEGYVTFSSEERIWVAVIDWSKIS